ncbi:agmatine deiminase family protein [Streptomyces specialis]|uniref:agmatine deiminase family protein n=1 Tax=Streptomyces specialis TaxID=498367 RepID=UPI00073F2F6B|nr:agmatine deiminase family protein [Streptomyces specialis]
MPGIWRMPHETAEQARTWMAWPPGGYTLGDDPFEAETARRAWAAVANAIVGFQPVSMLVTERERPHAAALLSPGVEILVTELDDAWLRDTGPTFVVSDGPEPRLAAVDWVFNGWGAQEWATWDADALVGRAVAGLAEAMIVPTRMVAEGGGLHTDGEGTFLVTETVMLDPGRNPGWTRERVEDELARTVGAEKVIWLPRGLTRDYGRFGTRGHIDILATFPGPGRVLVHDQRHEDHPDHEVSRHAAETLAAATDARGRRLTVRGLPAPEVVKDEDGDWVDYSYVNHVVCNGAVIACAFGDPADKTAMDILAHAYPGRRIVPVDARPLFARGGGAHCVTQQQPAIPPAPPHT